MAVAVPSGNHSGCGQGAWRCDPPSRAPRVTGRPEHPLRPSRRSRRVVIGAILGITVLAAVACSQRLQAPQTLSAGPFACLGNEAINVATKFQSDGAALHLLLRGRNCSAPVLLWLHGGPGGAETPLFRLYDGALERHFVVAYLDQRGAGQSYDPASDPAQLTVAQHLADLDNVIRAIEQILPGRKVTLVGHSWGAMLGLLYAARHPDSFAQMIAVNPLVSTAAAQKEQYDFAIGEARARQDGSAEANLLQLGPPPYDATDELRVQSFVDNYGGYFHRRPNRMLAVVEGSALGLVNPFAIPRYIEANDVSLKAMMPELLHIDLRREIAAMQVPVTFMLGRFDHQISNAAALDLARQIGTPPDRIVWFDHSAHNIPFEEPDAFVGAVTTIARPGSVQARGVISAPSTV
ncbi:MAG: alpha/beta fold hydrolase [Porphyrobacter sp.]|nr:alpha/beta fold hydrolase [Porphyrobacter sp.]